MNYYIIIIIVVYDIKLSNVIRLFIGFDKFTYFSGGSGMEAGTINIDLLRLKCVFLNSSILVLNIILYTLYMSCSHESGGDQSEMEHLMGSCFKLL